MQILLCIELSDYSNIYSRRVITFPIAEDFSYTGVCSKICEYGYIYLYASTIVHGRTFYFRENIPINEEVIDS